MLSIEIFFKVIDDEKFTPKVWPDGCVRENIYNTTYVLKKLSWNHIEIRMIPIDKKRLENYIDCLTTIQDVCLNEYGLELLFEKDNDAE